MKRENNVNSSEHPLVLCERASIRMTEWILLLYEQRLREIEKGGNEPKQDCHWYGLPWTILCNAIMISCLEHETWKCLLPVWNGNLNLRILTRLEFADKSCMRWILWELFKLSFEFQMKLELKLKKINSLGRS